jgi:hypothetical protein
LEWCCAALQLWTKLPNLRKMPFHKFLNIEWLFALL